MARLITSLILLLTISFCNAQVDMVVLQKLKGKEISEVLLDSIITIDDDELELVFSNTKRESVRFKKSNIKAISAYGEQFINRSLFKINLISSNNGEYNEIIEMKKNLNGFRKARSGGHFLQALGAGITIAGSFLVVSDAKDENFTGASKGTSLAALGGGLSLLGFIINWGAGNKINYDSDIATYNGKKKKTKNN